MKKEEQKQDKKDGIKVTIVTEENPTEFYQKVKVNGTLNDVSSYKLYDSIDFENLIKFWIKHQVIIILKQLSFKSRWNKFQWGKIGERKCLVLLLRKLKKGLF